MRESKLENEILQFCRSCDLHCYKITSPQRRGIPDRLIMGKGKVLFMEVKRPGQRPTALQLLEIDRIESKGLRAVWVDNYTNAITFISAYFRL